MHKAKPVPTPVPNATLGRSRGCQDSKEATDRGLAGQLEPVSFRAGQRSGDPVGQRFER